MKKSEYIEKSNSLKFAINQLKVEKGDRLKCIEREHKARVMDELFQYEKEVSALYADIQERKAQLQFQLDALEVEWAKEEEKSNLV